MLACLGGLGRSWRKEQGRGEASRSVPASILHHSSQTRWDRGDHVEPGQEEEGTRKGSPGPYQLPTIPHEERNGRRHHRGFLPATVQRGCRPEVRRSSRELSLVTSGSVWQNRTTGPAGSLADIFRSQRSWLIWALDPCLSPRASPGPSVQDGAGG